MPATAHEPCIAALGYELHFESLFSQGRGLAFPCDSLGKVDLDQMSMRARTNYLYARAVVGNEYRFPAVRRNSLC